MAGMQEDGGTIAAGDDVAEARRGGTEGAADERDTQVTLTVCGREGPDG
jgi:hypothetical protein